LKIHTKEVRVNYEGCGICKLPLEENVRKMKCEHTFHEDCLAMLKGLDEGRCVLCRELDESYEIIK